MFNSTSSKVTASQSRTENCRDFVPSSLGPWIQLRDLLLPLPPTTGFSWKSRGWVPQSQSGLCPNSGSRLFSEKLQIGGGDGPSTWPEPYFYQHSCFDLFYIWEIYTRLFFFFEREDGIPLLKTEYLKNLLLLTDLVHFYLKEVK